MAPYKGFVGPTYPARSYAVSTDRVINWYPEIVESKLGKSIINYYPTPGYMLHCDCSAIGAGRGAFALDGRQWAVIGGSLVEFDVWGAFTEYPGLANDGNPAYIVANAKTPSELLICSADHGYVFDTGADTLNEVAGEFMGGRMPAFLDGFGIVLTPDSRQIQISGINDFVNWAAIDVSANLGSADKVKAIISDHEYLYQYGSKRTAVYANTGDADFPIKPVPGAFIEAGIRAPASLKRFNNTLIWYGENEDGAGSVWRMEGFIPRRVSTHAIEAVWSQYGLDDDAIGFVQNKAGHGLYRLTFPAQDQTWVYDLATDMWHERAEWDSAAALWHAQRVRFHCYATGGTYGRYFLVGTDGKIYSERDNVYTEDGRLVKRVRVGPVVANQNKMAFVTRLEVVVEPGIGLDGDPAAQGANPEMVLQYSGDSGKTWSSEITCGAGRIGDTDARVAWDQLGSGRAWLPSVSTTDPNNWVIVDANIEVTFGAW